MPPFYVQICDQLITTAQGGAAVDWGQLPPGLHAEVAGNVENSSDVEIKPSLVVDDAKKNDPASIPDAVMPITGTQPSEAASPMLSVPQPSSTLEALEQHLEKYKGTMEQAQTEGNSSKARRLGRIVKQYQDAIKACKAGRPVPFDELPDPPGIKNVTTKIKTVCVKKMSFHSSQATPRYLELLEK